MSREKIYLWQLDEWPPKWVKHNATLEPLLAQVHRAHGHLLGRMESFGPGLRQEASLQMLAEDILKTSAIEGDALNADAVRSSLARRLGVDIGALPPADRQVEGIVQMTLDATQRYGELLTAERLHGWHAALFPTGYSGLSAIRVGQWRDDASGPMQVVSGPIGRRVVHYEAPPAYLLEAEMEEFLLWFNVFRIDPFIKAGLAHLWLVSIHPYEDGNGRIARAVGDMALAHVERSPMRFYSLSSQIQRERAEYYRQLERAQKGTLDATAWLEWFLGCLLRAIEASEQTLATVLAKARFWQRWAGTPLNARQIKLLNRLLDSFEGKLTSSKWAEIAKCSPDTALRDINELMALGMLGKASGGGRSTAYTLET